MSGEFELNRGRLKYLLLSIFLSVAAKWAHSLENVFSAPGRAGVTVPYLLTAVTDKPAWVFVLLSGGYGEHRLSQRGDVIQIYGEERYLARTRALFAGSDAAAALLDVPSDKNRLSDSFRASDHVEDIVAVVADLQKRYPASKVVLVGHSNGTISAAHAATRLGDRLDAVVLVSGRLVSHWFGGGALANFDFSGIGARLLLVHHLLDGCPVTPYAGSLALAARFPLVTVQGPQGLDAGGCSSTGTHNLSGRDHETVSAIRAWVAGQAWPKTIE